MSLEDVEILRAVYERWAHGDFWTPEVFDTKVEAMWGPDIPGFGTYHGLAGLEEGWREFLAAWEEVTFTADEFIDVGDGVLVLVTARGRGSGSGVETETKFSHAWAMRDGKGTRIAAYLDRAEALKAVGLEE